MKTDRLDRPARANASSFELEWWMPLVAFATAWFIRLFRVAYVTNFIDDRYMNVPSAFNFTKRGLLGPDNWWTQPAKHILLYADMLLYGNDPVGWRMREVLFGTLAVLMVFLIARRLFKAPFPAFAAAALYALDPLQVAFSRASSEDVPAVFFMLAGVLFWLRAIEEERFGDWLATGLLFGTALALRIHVVLVVLVLLGITAWIGRKRGAPYLSGVAAHLLIVPAAGYLVWWFPYFAAGNTLGDLWSLHVDTYLVQTAGIFPRFDPEILRLAGARGWFTRWIGAGYALSGGGSSKEYTVMANDPLVWFLFLPAMIVVAREAYRYKKAALVSVAGAFAALCLLFAGVPRDVMVYSALAVIPFGFLALGFALWKLPRAARYAATAILVGWSLYLLPLTLALDVSGLPYGWLLTRFGM